MRFIFRLSSTRTEPMICLSIKSKVQNGKSDLTGKCKNRMQMAYKVTCKWHVNVKEKLKSIEGKMRLKKKKKKGRRDGDMKRCGAPCIAQKQVQICYFKNGLYG